ncbi:MAG: nucleotidyltransferase family protein [Pseudomonadota bacterium]
MDSTSKLLLVTAKSSQVQLNTDLVRKLASDVRDWQKFVDIASAKFSIPFAQQHLKKLASDIVPDTVLQSMSSISQSYGLASLKLAAAQIEFHKNCIAPLDVEYVYLKGIALSTQTGGKITDRFSRDIDILVGERDVKQVIDRAVSQGYRIILEADPIEVVQCKRDRDFYTNYADVVTLLSPDEVMIEVHRKLTKLSLNFDKKAMFANSDRISVSGTEMRTLSVPMHFVYVCYHHARHFWSKLHWLADIDAFLRSEKFSRNEVIVIASKLGIEPMVRATFDFHEKIDQTNRWDDPAFFDTHGGQYLSACLKNLRGGMEIEEEMRKHLTLGDFMSSWQVSKTRHKELWVRSWLHRVKPTVTQYRSRRYPFYFTWLYYAENVINLAKNAWRLAFPTRREHVKK